MRYIKRFYYSSNTHFLLLIVSAKSEEYAFLFLQKLNEVVTEHNYQ